ncbi:MAG: PIN domain-containing protein [SAR324 cluster bacterium]|nr:PIN domain-containing protein [SAR324 cluster bacterium]
MKKVIIDTNTLISFVTDRNISQQKKSEALFEEASRLKLTVLCHQNVLTEFVYVMEKIYKTRKEKINEIISDFILMPGMELIHEVEMKDVLKLWPTEIHDYGDALLAAFCKQTKNSSIATFDLKFQNAIKKRSLPIYLF